MKRKLFIGGILFSMLFFGGCTKPDWLKTSDEIADEIADELCYNVVMAIEKKDENALRDLFSEMALERCEDFEEGFSYATELYSGEFQGMEKVSHKEEAHYDSGKRSWETYVTYIITTSENTYVLYLYYFPADTIIPSREGLYRLMLWEDVTHTNYSKFSGIYNPLWDEKKDGE